MTLGQNSVLRYGNFSDFFGVFLGIEWPGFLSGTNHMGYIVH